MERTVKEIFKRQIIVIDLDRLLPTREIKPSDECFGKYKAVVASIKAMGVVEPIAVHPCRGKSGYFVILDGHLRHKALTELGTKAAECLVSTEEDPFTYNDKISRLSCIQEHRMIMKALGQGITPQELSETLAVNLDTIRASANLLNGIHPEAVEKLKDKPVCVGAMQLFKKVKPLRQIEFAELMVTMGDYSASYARALLVGTKPEMMVENNKPKVTKLKPEELDQMEREMENLERDSRVYQDRYGEDALSLNVVQRYVQRLLGNAAVKKFLTKRYPEILEELTVVAGMETL
jgi:hypothetical protein